MTKTIAVLCVALAVPAFAQSEGTRKKPVPVQKMNFEEASEIEAGPFGPDVITYDVPKRPGGFKNLIKVRMNFDDKLRDSVHEM